MANLRYRAEIDGLRAVAVIPVVFFHGDLPWFSNGYLGVDIFFVISGYLICSLLLASEAKGTAFFVDFYQRRARRILPALLPMLIVTAIGAALIVSPMRMQEIADSIIAALGFAANFWFLSQTHYFSTPSTLQPLIHLWSLSVEEQFYIAFPLLMFLLRSLRRPALMISVLAVLATLSLILAHAVGTGNADAAFYRPDTRAWELLLGALCAFPDRERLPLRGTLSFVGLAAIIAAYFVLQGPQAPGIGMLPVCLGTALIVLCTGPTTMVGRVLATPPLRFIGLCSYSLYLWHQPILALARLYTLGALSPAVTATVFAVSALLAAISWQFIERPARNTTMPTGRLVWCLVSGGALALILSIGALATNGYAFRYGDKAGQYFASLDPLDDSGSVRTAAIRMGTCHFRADMSPALDVFLRNWNCTGTPSGRGILVVGDSHAADLAAGFELNGRDVGQMTGAGCSTVPHLMSSSCRALFDTVVARQHDRMPFRVLIIANNQTAHPFTDSDIKDLVDYWRALGIPISIMSDMPQFSALSDRKAANLLADGDTMAGDYPVTLAAAQAGLSRLRAQSAGQFTVIDSSELYCSVAREGSACLPYRRDVGWLATGGGHLTAVGARLFVSELLANPSFEQLTGMK